MILRVESLDTSYGRLPILHEISVEVGEESVGLFGPNGAGKTTLINAIMGMVKPDSGRIFFQDNEITGLPTHRIVRGGIALVPQERELFPYMSVYDNLCLGAESIPAARERLEAALTEVFRIFPILKERASQLAGTMSGGQQRMLAVARALMARPKLLILDEPSLGLQPSIVRELFTILKEMKQSVSILMTEQNVRESLRAVDRGYILENGRVVLAGTAEELAHDPQVERSYLGL